MSRRPIDIDELLRSAPVEEPPRRWSAQRRIFRSLRLGGPSLLLFTRAAHAFAQLRASKWALIGAPTLAIAVTIAAGSTLALRADHADHAEPTHVAEAARPAPTVPAAPAELVATSASSDAVTLPSSADANPALGVAQPGRPSTAVTVDSLPSAPSIAIANATPPKSARETPAAASVRAPDTDDLTKETASVSKLRAKVAAGEHAGAVTAVRAHRAAFPHGVLAQEVDVLEIEALAGAGETARACSSGQAFLGSHPTSAHRARVASLLRACAR